MARFAAFVAGGISLFCVGALVVSHGQAHLFALGAVITGVAVGIAATIVRRLSRVHWTEALGIMAIASLIGDISRH